MSENTAKNILTPDKIVFFCSQTALILKSGITISDGMHLLIEDTENEFATEFINSIIESMDSQKPFFQALTDTGVFPEYAINMIRIGELTGKLDEVLDELCAYYEREISIKNAIRSSVTHPTILFIMMSVVIFIFVIKVLPIFKSVYIEMGSQMSASSLNAITFASNAGIITLSILGVIAAIVLISISISLFPKGRIKMINFLSKFFLTKKLALEFEISKFCAAMSLMISSGIESSEALDYSSKIINNNQLNSKIIKCRDEVKDFTPFSNAISEAEIFPSVITQMLKISYKSGSINSTWNKISSKYDESISNTLNNIVSVIEPVLIGVLSVIIGIIIISVMLPLMSIMSSIG